MFLEVVW